MQVGGATNPLKTSTQASLQRTQRSVASETSNARAIDKREVRSRFKAHPSCGPRRTSSIENGVDRLTSLIHGPRKAGG
jgi:hypothetical protein